MRKITKRDILFFFLGFLTLFTIETVMSWDSAVESFKKGYNDAHQRAIDAEKK